MTEMKSQFLNTETKPEGSYTQGHLLLDSLNLVTADVRGGLDTENKQRVERMSAYVDSLDDSVKQKTFNAYVKKITNVAATESTQKAALKLPNKGMM